MNINSISDIILNETSSPGELRDALNAFVLLCGDISGIRPDASFDAWAGDSLLNSGVAINPQAAAHCAVDYQRSVIFIRGVHAAINTLKLRFPDIPLEILYAGCGPFATLLLPLLGKFTPGELRIYMLDIHQRSLDSVELLLAHFGYGAHAVRIIQDDACHYKHPGKLHLVIAETMQKSLEQEPQFAVTANLAPQLWPTGVFIPQRIEVALYLADLAHEKELICQSQQIDREALEKSGSRYPIAKVCTLAPECASAQIRKAQHNAHTTRLALEPITVAIPELADITRFDATLFTRISVFEQYRLEDYESEITLPLRCHELAPLAGGERYRVSYQLGSYPTFNFERLPGKEP
jgi:hypothetical protein